MRRAPAICTPARSSAPARSRIASTGSVGSACIAERRGIELEDQGKASTPFMKFGDRVRIEVRDARGSPLFGAIDQRIVAGACAMNVLVTGANGFIGASSSRACCRGRSRCDAGWQLSQLTLLDQRFGTARDGSTGHAVEGDLGLAEIAARSDGRDARSRLSSRQHPGRRGDEELRAGSAGQPRRRPSRCSKCCGGRATSRRVVFASTIAVYGVPMPDVIDENTLPEPSMSYGAHKLIGEILISDYSRRGFIDGRALRLPGIVARPPQPSGMLSAFMSDMIRELGTGERSRVRSAPKVVPGGCRGPASSTTCCTRLRCRRKSRRHDACGCCP